MRSAYGFDSRVYLLDVTDRCPNRRTMQELVDVLARFGYTEFYLYDTAKERETPLETAKIESYCRMQGIGFKVVGEDFRREMEADAKTVVAPTFAARSLCGRIEEMREAMERAEATGSKSKATRFVVTDFSDGYAWHPLCVSLPAIILAGNMMTAGRVAAKMDLEKDLCSVMDLPVGGLLQKLGTLYLRGGAVKPDSSEYFNILAGDVGYSRHPGLTQFVLDDVSAVARGVRIALERWLERSDWAKEISYAALLLECSCHRRDERRLRELRDLHGHIWRMRFEPEGRVESLSKIPRF